MCQRKGLTTVKELSVLPRVNYKWLERSFRHYTGLPPKVFLQQHRFIQACLQLLASPQADFMAITLEHGYCDQNHFIKVFKQFTGKAPGQFLQAAPHQPQ